MSHAVTIGANTVSIAILVFAIYFPRHRDRDMVVSYLGINAGVLVIASVLSTVEVSLGVGIGLFGVLSIIRLRSDELNQRQVAYYFAALALGLLGGTAVTDARLTIALMGFLLGAMWIGDSPSLLSAYRTRTLIVDRAFVSEEALTDYLAPRIAGTIKRVSVIRADLVNDTTLVSVRYTETPAATAGVAPPAPVAHWRTVTEEV